jgi:hypothetical protein
MKKKTGPKQQAEVRRGKFSLSVGAKNKKIR